MKVDFYTKTILTVIAVCLVTQVLRSFNASPVGTAYAAETPQVMDVNIVSLDGQALYRSSTSLPVRNVQ